MTLVVCVPYTGFIPGQIIPLTIELDNNSNVAIEAVKIKLERVKYSIIFLIFIIFAKNMVFLESRFQSKAP
jgi:hypothetical protein